jgi:hypothetical protein
MKHTYTLELTDAEYGKLQTAIQDIPRCPESDSLRWQINNARITVLNRILSEAKESA